MSDIFDILLENHRAFLLGLKVTLQICLIVWFAGLFLGLVLAVLAYKKPFPFFYVFSSITLTLIAIPLLVILYWFHYPFQTLIGFNIDPFVTATFTLTLLNTFLVYQMLINSFRNFPDQYISSAKVCGLSSHEIIRKIQIPLIVRDFIPGFLALQVFMLQSSIFSSLISVSEIFRKAQQINADLQKPVEIYTAMAIFFLIICLPIYLLAYYLYKKYSVNISEV